MFLQGGPLRQARLNQVQEKTSFNQVETKKKKASKIITRA